MHPQLHAEIIQEPIPFPHPFSTQFSATAGALVEFRGIVRDSEHGGKIRGLMYEAYESMAQSELLRILTDLKQKWGFESAWVTHRIGEIAAGEASIYVGIRAGHRAEAFSSVSETMDLLKKDVPIWKTRVLT